MLPLAFLIFPGPLRHFLHAHNHKSSRPRPGLHSRQSSYAHVSPPPLSPLLPQKCPPPRPAPTSRPRPFSFYPPDCPQTSPASGERSLGLLLSDLRRFRADVSLAFTLRNLTHLLHARVSSSLALPYKPCLTCLPHLPASPACLTWAASSFGPRQPSSPRPLKPVATRDSPDGRNDDCMTITSLRPLTDPPSSPAHPHSSHPLPPVLQQPSLPPTPQLPR
ncbi:protein enabled homolog [Portunus trituberculatus]|uniref:protein enabled homolog n=1 Tax=Portunus trituberculatus TaxID=210409 RepID=UPI001E1CDE20|nr:protein enabled homolog [Portunus trituberculatus]